MEVEADPPAMGVPVVWVQGKSGALPALEFVLVKPCDDPGCPTHSTALARRPTSARYPS